MNQSAFSEYNLGHRKFTPDLTNGSFPGRQGSAMLKRLAFFASRSISRAVPLRQTGGGGRGFALNARDES